MFTPLVAVVEGFAQRRISEWAAWQRWREKVVGYGRHVRRGRNSCGRCWSISSGKRQKYPSTRQRLELASLSTQQSHVPQPLVLLQQPYPYPQASLSHLFHSTSVTPCAAQLEAYGHLACPTSTLEPTFRTLRRQK